MSDTSALAVGQELLQLILSVVKLAPSRPEAAYRPAWTVRRSVAGLARVPGKEEGIRAESDEIDRQRHGQPPSQPELSLLLELRTLVETTVVLAIAKDRERLELVKERLSSIHNEMQAIVDESISWEGEKAHAWDLDVRFHCELCRIGGYPAMAQVFQVLQNGVRPRGLARDRATMRVTLGEHKDILDAVLASPPDEDRIRRAVAGHIRRAGQRWFPEYFQQGSDGAEPQGEDAMDEGVSAAGAPPSELSAISSFLDGLNEATKETLRDVLTQTFQEASGLSPEARQRMGASLRVQFEYPGEYVAYRDSWAVNGSAPRFHRKVLMHSRSQGVICDFVARLSADEQASVSVDYQPDPRAPVDPVAE